MFLIHFSLAPFAIVLDFFGANGFTHFLRCRFFSHTNFMRRWRAIWIKARNECISTQMVLGIGCAAHDSNLEPRTRTHCHFECCQFTLLALIDHLYRDKNKIQSFRCRNWDTHDTHHDYSLVKIRETKKKKKRKSNTSDGSIRRTNLNSSDFPQYSLSFCCWFDGDILSEVIDGTRPKHECTTQQQQQNRNTNAIK